MYLLYMFSFEIISPRIEYIANYKIKDVVGNLAHNYMGKEDRPIVIKMQGLSMCCTVYTFFFLLINTILEINLF